MFDFSNKTNKVGPMEQLTIHLKKNFIEKERKTINVLTILFIFYKSGVKTFLKQIVNQYPKDTN